MSNVGNTVPDLQRGVDKLVLDKIDEEYDNKQGSNVFAKLEDKDMEESDEEEIEDFDEEAFTRKLLQGYYYYPPRISSGYCTNCVPNEVCKSCGHINGHHFDYKPTCCVICGNPEHDDFGYCSSCLSRPGLY